MESSAFQMILPTKILFKVILINLNNLKVAVNAG